MKKKIRGLDLSIEFVCSLIVAISLSFYIYCAHFRFPFEATDFLYIAFIIAIAIIIIRRKLIINKALLIYLLIVLYTGLGYLYSNNPEDGLRQTLFFAIYFVFYWLAMQGGTFLQLMKKIIYIFSLMGMISVFAQFFKPELINAFLFRYTLFGAELRDVFAKVPHAPLTIRQLSVCFPEATSSLPSRFIYF